MSDALLRGRPAKNEAAQVTHPSAAELLEELREPGESYESLAARLPISLSTVNRWKKRSPRDWDTQS